MAATMALAFCFAIELSQLLHVRALDTLRRTTAGHLALGSGFDPRDFASVRRRGACGGVFVERTHGWFQEGPVGGDGGIGSAGSGQYTRDR